ncbi:MAG: Type I phosphodiesterase / nucleotide pyrophosphatase [Candidatus Methanoperedenaceae archaeon GB50]|nr:MAG: Type I phosphodiesterase / nucleotide pyrophosphatase [Candidatus Methanoperedenaceae archaeon GB50]
MPKEKMNVPRVLVLGLDGATWELLMPWIKQNILPNFKKFIMSGCYGKLESTIPADSPQAWNAIYTGKNPSKHGILGFLRFTHNNYFWRPITSKDRKGESIWTLLAKNNQKSIVFNAPFTYPPEEINGIMISGLGTPSKDSNFIYPLSFKKEFLSKFPDYGVHFREEIFNTKPPEEFLKYIDKIVTAKIEAFKYLVFQYPWDLFLGVFRSTDLLQHFFWGNKDILLYYYKKFDNLLGYIIQNVGENVYIIVCSDHGFGPVFSYVYINCWLEQLGLLKFRKKTFNLSSSLSKFGITAENANKILLRLGLGNFAWKIKKLSFLEKLLQIIPSSLYGYMLDIDWSKTKAYFIEGSGGMININLKSRQPRGTVDEKDYESFRNYIICEAEKLIDPTKKQKIVIKAFTKEELFGNDSYEIPDIILQRNEGYVLLGYHPAGKIFASNPPSGVKRPADHRQYGIFVAKGSYIKQGECVKAKVIDIAPTILHILDIPIPEDMDGRVLKEIFESHSKLAQVDITYQKTETEMKRYIKQKIRKLKKIRKFDKTYDT